MSHEPESSRSPSRARLRGAVFAAMLSSPVAGAAELPDACALAPPATVSGDTGNALPAAAVTSDASAVATPDDTAVAAPRGFALPVLAAVSRALGALLRYAGLVPDATDLAVSEVDPARRVGPVGALDCAAQESGVDVASSHAASESPDASAGQPASTSPEPPSGPTSASRAGPGPAGPAVPLDRKVSADEPDVDDPDGATIASSGRSEANADRADDADDAAPPPRHLRLELVLNERTDSAPDARGPSIDADASSSEADAAPATNGRELPIDRAEPAPADLAAQADEKRVGDAEAEAVAETDPSEAPGDEGEVAQASDTGRSEPADDGETDEDAEPEKPGPSRPDAPRNAAANPFAARDKGTGDEPATPPIETMPELPPPVRDLRVASTTQAFVDLEWSAPPGTYPSGYDLYRDGTLRARTTAPGFLDQAVRPGVTYRYRVSAVTEAGVAGRPSAALVVVAGDPELRDARPPSAPSAVIVRDGGTGLLVTWQPGSDDDAVRGYEVRRNGVHVGTSFSSAWFDREAPATNAAYEIVAFDRAGNLSRASVTASVSGTLPYGVGDAMAAVPNAVVDAAPELGMTVVNESRRPVVVVSAARLDGLWRAGRTPRSVRVSLDGAFAPLQVFALDADGGMTEQLLAVELPADPTGAGAAVIRDAPDGGLLVVQAG